METRQRGGTVARRHQVHAGGPNGIGQHPPRHDCAAGIVVVSGEHRAEQFPLAGEEGRL
jgi:hypothetical protein